MPTAKLESVAFTIEAGQVTRTSTGSRAALKFEAAAKRHFDGGFEAEIYAVLFDARGRFVHRRSADRSRTVLSNRATWTHEIDNDAIASATKIVYEISHRFDYRRKIVSGELPELPPQADGSDYFRWIDLDPRTLEDRAVKFDIGFWARNSSFEITMSQTPKLITDSCRTEWEIELLDAQGSVAFARTGSIGLNYGLPSFDDYSVSMDRKAMRQLKFFELRGRTECRAVVPLVLDAIPPG